MLGLQLDGGEKEVEQESPFVAVQVVHQSNDALILEAVIAEVLLDDRPVFPFDVAVIVFVILSGSGIL